MIIHIITPKIVMRKKMKKLLSAFMAMMAVCFSTCLVACGDDDDPTQEPEQPVEDVKMGKYIIDFSSIPDVYWPDSDVDIQKPYAAYQKSMLDALKIDQNKKYKWSDIEADKDQIQQTYDSIGTFEYSVKSCRNHYTQGLYVSFCALKDGSVYSDIDFGSKKLNCKLDVPADATCQLHIEMKSYEAAVPSAKEYVANVRSLFTDALKDVFTGEYAIQEKTESVTYMNITNYSGDRDEFLARIEKVCKAIEVPELPANVKEDAQAATTNSGAKITYIFSIDVFAFDPKATNVHRNIKYPVSYKVEVK